MEIPTYATIIEELFSELQNLLSSYVFQGYNAMASYLRVPLGLAIVLYIVLMGISISQGWIKLSMSHLSKSALKLSLIYTAAMSWGWFSASVVDLITTGSGQISAILINATPIHLPHLAGEGINGALQTVLIEFTKIGSWVWDMGSWHNMGPYFTAVIIWGFGLALILVSVFELALAQIMLAILFATAPLFVSFTLFKPTQGFFDRWLGACVGFGLLMIFVSSMLALALSVSQWAIAGTYASHAANVSLVGFIPIVAVGFIGIGIILKAAQLAQSIGGTVSTSSGASMLAGTLGGFIGGSLSTLRSSVATAKSGRNVLNLMKNGFVGAGRAGGSTFSAIRSALIKPERTND